MTQEQWTIPGLLQLSGGYWSTCALHAGVSLGVFTHLDGIELSAEDTARMSRTDSRGMELLLDSLTSLGLLEKSESLYRATPFSSYALSKKSEHYLGHIIMHHHHLMSGWSALAEAVRSGAPVRESVSHGDDDTVRESFLMGMFNLASLMAPKLAAAVDLSRCRTLLDLGGGPGTYAIHFCQANPTMSATVFDLPTTRAFAEKTIDRFELSSRIRFVHGDYHADPLPNGFDAAWLSHILHSDGPADCVSLLKKAVAALNPGGILLIQEFVMNDEKSGPPFPALFSLNMLIGTDSGRSYSDRELRDMMREAGLTDINRVPLDLPNGSGILTGHVAA